ncbi:unnamed protein product [Diamesa serratosioi]
MNNEKPLAVPAYPQVNPQAYPQVHSQAYPQVHSQGIPQIYPQALPGQAFPDNTFAPQQPPPSYQQHYQPQQYYQPQQQAQVIQTSIIMQSTVVGPDPTIATCPSCRATITTTVRHEAGNKTHLFALGLCLIGCWPCCLYPYCIDSCQNANHTCPNCNSFVGTYRS